MRTSRVKLRALAASFAVFATTSAAGAAEPRDPAAAEALFAEGQRLIESSDYAAACPKLEESYRLDPATGALLALALCHERQGRIASAWVEFMDAASRASAEGNAEREQSARQHAEALKSRLSYLSVVVDLETAALENLVIARSGVALGQAAWGSPIPVDPGPHVVLATAPGYAPWTTNINVGAGSDRRTVRVPKLVPLAAPPTKTDAPRERPAPPELFGMPLTPLRIAGLSVGVAGITSLGFATYSALRAVHLNKASKNECTGPDDNECEAERDDDRAAALEAANIATVSVVAGGALLATGITLFALGAPNDDDPRVSFGPSGLSFRTAF